MMSLDTLYFDFVVDRISKKMDSLKIFWLVVLLKMLSLSSLCCHKESLHHIKLPSCKNQYSESCNTGENDVTTEEIFKRGHMKPFGSHRPADFIVEELPYMISPQEFYMNFVAKHKPVVIKGKQHLDVILLG